MINQNQQELKKPKINDLINFITSGNSQIPESFLFYEKELKNLVQYVFEWFWYLPNFVKYLNEFNNLYDRSIQEQPIEFLKFLQQLCKDNKISKYHLKNSFFNYYAALNKIKELENEAIKQKRQFIDYYSEIKLKQILGKEIQIKKAKKVDDKNKKEKIKEIIQNAPVQKENYNNMILKELNDEIIEELQLTLFDVFLNENNNELIYIFIDKNYNKRYYIEPYYIDILVSKDTTIFKNDYLKEIDNSFIKYRITNIWNFRNLKKAIVYNFDNQKNLKG